MFSCSPSYSQGSEVLDPWPPPDPAQGRETGTATGIEVRPGESARGPVTKEAHPDIVPDGIGVGAKIDGEAPAETGLLISMLDSKRVITYPCPQPPFPCRHRSRSRDRSSRDRQDLGLPVLWRVQVAMLQAVEACCCAFCRGRDRGSDRRSNFSDPDAASVCTAKLIDVSDVMHAEL